MLSRGRTIVAEALQCVSISSSDNKQLGGNIAAAMIWYAPRERLRTLPSICAIAHRVLLNWGLRAWKRTDEFGEISHTAHDTALKQRRLEFKDVWYLRVYLQPNG
ncbi:hypothetical protein GYMLUDRAFT_934898 [Collybiopsis luxurians FD-317 M1]|nr:hypothetical protein GYMLUDRAFT_934898 [Collybiopsis luxurians FD-317 M1]